MYWTHCNDCREHFYSRSGWCEGCHDDECTTSSDDAAEKGCAECKKSELENAPCPKCKGKGAIPNPDSFIWTICECRRGK